MSYIDAKNSSKSSVQIGGNPVKVIVAPRGATGDQREGLFRIFFKSVKSLLTGMKVTIGYLFRPSTVVTQQYPENRETLKMFERFRGQLRLVKDENNYMNCNGCDFCEKACPNGSIILHDRRNPVSGKSELERYVWRLDSCTFCNACIQACPHDALEWSDGFEAAVYDRRLLVYTLNDYAGPAVSHIKRAKKKADKEEDPTIDHLKDLLDTREPRKQFGGPTPLAGRGLPGVPPLNTNDSTTKSAQ